MRGRVSYSLYYSVRADKTSQSHYLLNTTSYDTRHTIEIAGVPRRSSVHTLH